MSDTPHNDRVFYPPNYQEPAMQHNDMTRISTRLRKLAQRSHTFANANLDGVDPQGFNDAMNEMFPALFERIFAEDYINMALLQRMIDQRLLDYRNLELMGGNEVVPSWWGDVPSALLYAASRYAERDEWKDRQRTSRARRRMDPVNELV